MSELIVVASIHDDFEVYSRLTRVLEHFEPDEVFYESYQAQYDYALERREFMQDPINLREKIEETMDQLPKADRATVRELYLSEGAESAAIKDYLGRDPILVDDPNRFMPGLETEGELWTAIIQKMLDFRLMPFDKAQKCIADEYNEPFTFYDIDHPAIFEWLSLRDTYMAEQITKKYKDDKKSLMVTGIGHTSDKYSPNLIDKLEAFNPKVIKLADADYLI